jgi:hypothetical protein
MAELLSWSFAPSSMIAFLGYSSLTAFQKSCLDTQFPCSYSQISSNCSHQALDSSNSLNSILPRLPMTSQSQWSVTCSHFIWTLNSLGVTLTIFSHWKYTFLILHNNFLLFLLCSQGLYLSSLLSLLFLFYPFSNSLVPSLSSTLVSPNSPFYSSSMYLNMPSTPRPPIFVTFISISPLSSKFINLIIYLTLPLVDILSWVRKILLMTASWHPSQPFPIISINKSSQSKFYYIPC